MSEFNSGIYKLFSINRWRYSMTQVVKTHEALQIPIFMSTNNDWMRSVVEIAQSKGYEVERCSQGIVIWRPTLVNKESNALESVEAILVSRESLPNTNNKFICLIPKRLYFKNGKNQPSYEIEHLILEGRKRKFSPMNIVIKEIIRFGDLLVSSNKFSALPQPSTQHDIEILKFTRAEGAASEFPLTKDMWQSCSANGWKNYPEHLTIHFIGDPNDPRTAKFILDYTRSVKEKWSRATCSLGGLSVKAWSLLSFLERAKATTNKPQTFSENDVVVIALTGKKGEPLPDLQSELMNILDNWQQSYRLVSLSTVKNNYWSSTHVLSLLNSVGAPYSLRLPFPKPFDSGVFLGIDIGHDHTHRTSNIVVTAVNPEGKLVASTSKTLTLNEALYLEHIKTMLKETIVLAERRQNKIIDQAIIIRDGRIPNNNKYKTYETVHEYVTALGIPSTLIELRKRNNPPIFLKNKAEIAIGVNFHLSSSNVRYATFYDCKIGIPNTFKIVLPKGADGLGWGIDAYVKILCGLCYTPSLGSQPHLPGPIYWADGFAKTSKLNNQFRGHYVDWH